MSARRPGSPKRTSPTPEPRHQSPATPRQSRAVQVATAATLSPLIVELADQAVAPLRSDANETPSGKFWLRDPRLAKLAWVDRNIVIGCVRSMLRWWGWLAPLDAATETRLLLASLLDAREPTPMIRHWAHRNETEKATLLPLGDAPDWTAKTTGFKRILGFEPPTVDPWRLFPEWFRSAIQDPPGTETLKTRQIHLIAALQTPAPVWLRAQAESPKRVWDVLRASGVKPWIHRTWPDAARLDDEIEVSHLGPTSQGLLELHDLSSQWVGHCANPQPGERWWAPDYERAQEVIHLAALMQGRGVVLASQRTERPLRALELHARRTPFRNISTKIWDGKRAVGKPRTYDGVLVAPRCTGIGLWRRAPELRWISGRVPLTTYAEAQTKLLAAARHALKPRGLLIYAVPTITQAETLGVVQSFVSATPELKLKPFTDPLTQELTDGTRTLWPPTPDTDHWFLARMTWIPKSPDRSN